MNKIFYWVIYVSISLILAIVLIFITSFIRLPIQHPLNIVSRIFSGEHASSIEYTIGFPFPNQAKIESKKPFIPIERSTTINIESSLVDNLFGIVANYLFYSLLSFLIVYQIYPPLINKYKLLK